MLRYLPNTNTITIDYSDLVPEFLKESNYKHHKAKMRVHGYGGNGRIVMIEVESLPVNVQVAIGDKYGDLHTAIARQPIKQLVREDVAARTFYANRVLPGGGHLKPAYVALYGRKAEWLNMIKLCLTDKKTLKEVLRVDVDTFWRSVVDLSKDDKPVNPELPTDLGNLRKLYKQYVNEGYACLISKKFGNQNTRKVTDKIENLIFSLYNLEYKPTMAEVCRMYRQFMAGELKVVDMHPESGGELFDPQQFYVQKAVKGAKKGAEKVMVPYVLAESTVQFYLKKLANLIATHSKQIKGLEFRTTYRPYVIRKAPQYAFSKLSMDDRDLPFKDLVGDRPAKTYQIIDVASGCIVGKAYGIDKNVDLVRAAFRDMYQTIICNGWGFPAEMEMERHLTSHMQGKVNEDGEFEADILTAGNLFEHVRVCLGGNAPEKRAEHTFRHIKYQFNKKRPGFVGRFYAKSITNRFNEDQKATRYTYEQIVQNDLDDIEGWNNSLHPNQEQYPGMTRWDVLENFQNPNLVRWPISTVMPYIGFKAETSIRNGYVEVQYNKYRFHDLSVIAGLNNKRLTAYYIPGDMGVEKVYVYQGDKFIAECVKVVAFQEAVAEQTAADLEQAAKQWSYQSHFDKVIREKRGEITPVGVMAAAVVSSRKVAGQAQLRVVSAAEEVDPDSYREVVPVAHDEYDFLPEAQEADMATRARMAL